jgi:hypothetical protein
LLGRISGESGTAGGEKQNGGTEPGWVTPCVQK